MSTIGGVLIAQEIRTEIESGRLVRKGDVDRVRGCSYDMTIGTLFWDNQIIAGADRQVVVPPGGVISIFTADELELPDDMCATAFAINKMSSKGFLVLNPGHVDPGFSGPLSVKALNIRKTSIALHTGDHIFTVIFQRLSGSTTPYPKMPGRTEREHDFNATVVETSPRTLFEVMPLDPSGPFPARDEVRRMIASHWSSVLARFSSILVLLFTAVLVIKAFYPSPAPEMKAEAPQVSGVPATIPATTPQQGGPSAVSPTLPVPDVPAQPLVDIPSGTAESAPDQSRSSLDTSEPKKGKIPKHDN